jgi:large subunit ribosomal protein L5
MSSATTEAPPARLKARYFDEIRPALIQRFGYSSVMQAPHLEKITLNMGVGLAKQDSKMLKAATEQLATIAGQQPSVRRARKSIAAFKLREGMPVGVAVTLRSERAYEFLDRLVSIAIPRIRDFRGLSPRSFDGRGNYSMGVREQIIFPEIDYDAIDQVRGLDITITTSASSDLEAFALLQALGMPFATQGRPKGYDPEADQAEAEAHAAAEAAKAAEAPPPGPTPRAATDTAPDEAPKDEQPAETAETAEAEPEPDSESESMAETSENDTAAKASEPDAAAQSDEPEAAGEPETNASADSAEEESPPETAEDSNEKESSD